MISVIIYLEAIYRNKCARFKGMLLKLYLMMHGCKVGKGLKCATFPYFKGFPNRNIIIGNYVDLGRNNTIELTKNGKLIIEDYVLLFQNVLISCSSQITLRKWCGIAENVSIRDGSHQFKNDGYFRLQDSVSQPIEIGEGAGIGAGCILLMGVKIGKGAFIGSNSVVTKKAIIEDNCIYAGNPIKLISKRT